jgi:hypothetical protein
MRGLYAASRGDTEAGGSMTLFWLMTLFAPVLEKSLRVKLYGDFSQKGSKSVIAAKKRHRFPSELLRIT